LVLRTEGDVRGIDNLQVSMLGLATPDKRVPTDHPLLHIRILANQALDALLPTFDEMYSRMGRLAIPPERLLKSALLIAFYSVRSERLFCEQFDYNLLFRWFLDMDMVEASFDHLTFSRNRERLLAHDVASKILGEVVRAAQAAPLMSDDHFTVDGTLIEAWASLKSFRPKDEKPSDRPAGRPGHSHGELARREAVERDAPVNDGPGFWSWQPRAPERAVMQPGWFQSLDEPPLLVKTSFPARDRVPF
jgi:transposase